MADDHEEALKWMLKSRISAIHKNIDATSVARTANALGRLLADLNALTNGLNQ